MTIATLPKSSFNFPDTIPATPLWMSRVSNIAFLSAPVSTIFSLERFTSAVCSSFRFVLRFTRSLASVMALFSSSVMNNSTPIEAFSSLPAAFIHGAILKDTSSDFISLSAIPSSLSKHLSPKFGFLFIFKSPYFM